MITVRVKAGLGNQLFQYAFGRHLSIRNNAELCLDTSWYYRKKQSLVDPTRQFLLDQFAINAQVTDVGDLRRLHRSFNQGFWNKAEWRLKRLFGENDDLLHIRESHFHYDPQMLNLHGNLYLTGLWQSEEYFKDIDPILRNELMMRDVTLRSSAEEYLDRLRNSFDEVVSVHVRRGDYLFTNQKDAQSLISADYYRRAMEFFPISTAYLFFSNSLEDVNWCKQQFGTQNVFFSESKSTLHDFVLMSACDHNIIANSTFSWWAAWLNLNPNKRVIAPHPDRWFGKKYQNYNLSTLLPSSWIRI